MGLFSHSRGSNSLPATLRSRPLDLFVARRNAGRNAAQCSNGSPSAADSNRHENHDEQHENDAESDQPRLVGFEAARYGVTYDPVRIQCCGGRRVHRIKLAPALPKSANLGRVGKRHLSVNLAISSYTRTMRIAVGSDHAGFDLKADLARYLAGAGHEVLDFGTDSAAVSVDYPIYGIAVAGAVAEGRAERGVCVCGTGIGISISANKVRGVRAALVHDSTSAALARRHGDANVICLGGRTTPTAEAIDLVDTFVSTAFEGGRHARRVAEISEYESSERTLR